jgi:hypothetical protein
MISLIRNWTRGMVNGYRTVRALCALLGVLLACSPPYGPKDLIGTWEGASKEMSSVVVSFGADGTCRLEYVNQQEEVHILTGDFEANFSKAPVPLTIRSIPQLPHPLHTIIQFKGADSLLMGSFAPRWRLRPISFSPATQILLERRPEDEAHTP